MGLSEYLKKPWDEFVPFLQLDAGDASHLPERTAAERGGKPETLCPASPSCEPRVQRWDSVTTEEES